MVVFVKLAPGPPLLVSRYSLYPVPGTAARKKLTELAIVGGLALVTGAVSDLGTHKCISLQNDFFR
jgi:hypothetical protein